MDSKSGSLPAPEFDTDFYFALVAENLVRRFGERAFTYAELALRKMRRMGDEEGLELWQGIAHAMSSIEFSRSVPRGISVH